MMLSIIVAYDKNMGIGINNKLPWHLKNDLLNFKKITENNIIVMGNNTYKSINYPLKNRLNIVLTKQKKVNTDKNCIFISNIRILKPLFNSSKEIFIIGGEEIYKMFFKIIDRMYITKVLHTSITDKKFICWNKNLFTLKYRKFFSKNYQNDFDFIYEIWNKIYYKI